MPDMSDADAEKMVEAAVMSMAEGIPMQVSCDELGVELLETLDTGGRPPELQLAMMAASLAAALKIIKRSVLNTPTTEKDTNR